MSKIDPLDAVEIAANVIGGPVAPVAKEAKKVKALIGLAKALFGKKPKRD